MSLSTALSTALTGLAVNQKALSVISQNIANANTVGYTRKVVDQSTIVLDGVGSGVKIDGVSRKVDEYLNRSVRSSLGASAKADVTKDYMGRLQIYLGEPGKSNSLDSQINDFFSAMQSLAETPERTSFRSQAVSTADQMARSVSGLASAAEDLRYQADQDISNGITGFNETIKKLSVVNNAIAQANSLGSGTAELLDKRDTLLTDVSKFMDAQISIQADGRAFVYTKNGQNVLNEQTYQLEYNHLSGPTDLSNGTKISPISIRRLYDNGSKGPIVGTLTSGTDDKGVVDSSSVDGGTLRGLLDIRDNTMPAFLNQLDSLASTVRDTLNAVNNQGSGYPGANSYTAERAMLPEDYTGLSGKVQIAVLNSDGTPVASPYPDETNGLTPLTLDFDKLNAGYGNGQPTLQSIIDEINNKFGAASNKASIGNLNQVELSSLSNNVPGVPPQFTFDFDLQNLSGTQSQFFVTDVSVKDDTGADITNVTTTQPQVSLDNANTYTTTAGSNVVTIGTAANSGLKVGDWVYLPDPGGSVDSIPASAISGYFQVKAVGNNSFSINITGSQALAGGTTGVNGLAAMPVYQKVDPGAQTRTGDSGKLTANLLGNTNSLYYDITANVGVVQPDGTVKTGTMTYHVLRDQNVLNQRFGASSVTGQAKLTVPSTTKDIARAFMVDENGTEIPTVNGKIASTKGFLKIQTASGDAYLSLTDVNSQETGVPGVKDASNRGFFHYMGLNNFFSANTQEAKGEALDGSALNFKVEKRMLDQPGLMTTGTLSQSAQPTDPTKAPNYTYSRYQGDNSLVQSMAKINAATLNFKASGGLPPANMTLSSYAGEMIGYMSDLSTNAQNDSANKATLTDGLKSRADSISGVNLDQELADTIVYQNAYTANARIITVTNSLFDSLLQAFQ